MPVGTINQAKELALTYQPLLLAEFTFQSGPVLRVASHPLNASEGGFQYGGQDWLARVLNYDITATQALSESGIDYTPQVSITLADTNRDLWTNFEQSVGFKGAQVTLDFVFWNVGANDFSSGSLRKFVGICGSPQIDNDTLSVTATSLMNMSQAMLPQIRIQKTCPWIFPMTATQRQEAADDESSQFHPCGYSPDATGSNAVGNLNGATPFTSCNYTYGNCLQRIGKVLDITKDSSDRPTGRFGGIQWSIPNTSWSRGYVSSKWEEIITTDNEAKYMDLIPLHYGEGWTDPLILTTDGSDNNFTKIHALLGWGEFQDISRVVVNGTTIPHTFNDGQMPQVPKGVGDATEAMKSGWWIAINNGDRNGAISGGITNLSEQPDPYGNLCVIEIVVPRKLADSSGTPRVQVLAKGPKLRVWFEEDPGGGAILDAATGKWFRREYTDNLAWVLMDVLIWANWRYSAMNISAFIAYASACNDLISYKDQHDITREHKRYTASLILRQRRSAAEIVRGLRNAGKALLYLDSDGLLTVKHKETLASQQPGEVAGSNYNTAISSKLLDGTTANGFAAYLFDESTIAKRSDRKTSSLTISQRGLNEAPNRVSFMFQDADNRYVPDSMTIIDAEDVARVGQEIAGQFPIEGINNLDQGRRCTGTWMAENYRGNARLSALGEQIGDTGGTTTYEWETTFRVIHLNIGDICMLNYQHLGVTNQLVRIIKIQPSSNFQRVKITALHHNDLWYLDTFGQQDAPRWRPDFRNRELRPAFSWCPHAEQPPVNDSMYGRTDWGFGIAQDYELAADGTVVAKMVVTGKMPVNIFSKKITPPFVGLQGTTASTGGTIAGGRSYWFMVCTRDEDGKLSAPSRLMAIAVPAGTNTNTVTVPITFWPTGTAGHVVFGGTSPNRMCFQAEAATTPASITLTEMNVATWGVPDSEFNNMLLKVRRSIHSGVWGQSVSEVTAHAIKVPVLPNAGFTVDQWVGYDLTLLGQVDTDAVNLPIFNATVTANTADGLISFGLTHPDTAVISINDVVVLRFKPTVGSDAEGDYIEDLGIINNLNSLEDPITINGATDTSPIEITTSIDHGYETGYVVYQDGVLGNLAANGLFTITKTGDNTYTLDGSTGNGDYQEGGTARRQIQGLGEPGSEKGLVLFFIAGTGRGMFVKVRTNTATRYYIEGTWPVTPDSTSRFIVLEPAWQLEVPQGTVNNETEDTQVSLVLDSNNYKNTVVFTQAYTVDGGSDESFPADSPFREIYQFGSIGTVLTEFVTIHYRSS